MQEPHAGVGRRHALSLMAMALAAPQTWAQSEQSFPNRPIKIIVPFTAGGTTDILARSIGQKLAEYWGQPVVVDNRPGAAGWIGITAMAKSPPDGYTIGLTISSIIYAKSLYNKLPFDIATDFEPVSIISRSAIALTVPAQFPANNLQEFIQYVRKNPGKCSYGSFGQGTSAHIFGETLNMTAKLDVVHVPFKGAAPIVTDLLGGQVDMMFATAAAVAPHIASGKLRALAVTSAERSSAMKSIPAIAETVKGYSVESWYGLFAPAGTPADVIAKLNAAAKQSTQTVEFRRKLEPEGLAVSTGTPQELDTYVKREEARWRKIVKENNIKPD